MGDAAKFIATGGIDSAVNALKPKEPRLPEDKKSRDVDAEEARRKELERLRKGAGANKTRRSGSVEETLTAAIGKTTLGGVK